MVQPKHTQKLYCYVDETGQDTQGSLFLVSVVITIDDTRDQAITLCETIEQVTGKGRRKWIKSRPTQRIAYIEQILQAAIFHGRLTFAVYYNTKAYLPLTIQTIARAIHAQPTPSDKVTVLIDGLPQAHQREVGTTLRHQGIPIRKVRGIRDEENDALCRLADAVCGLVRAALEGQEPYQTFFVQGKSRGVLIELV